MLNITKTEEKGALRIALEGRLDTTSSPELEQELRGLIPKVESLTLDLAKLDYISSAGLRVLLVTQKAMGKRGTLKLSGVNETVMEILEVTGFTEILNIE